MKRPIFFTFLMILSVILLESCFSGVILSPVNIMPQERPDEMLIHFRHDGGIINVTEEIYLHEDSSVFIYNYSGEKGRKYFKISERELNSLYRIFTDNTFEDIETEQKVLSDRGGITIKMVWNDNEIEISNAGENFIKNEWQEEWTNIISGVNAIRKKHSLNR